MEPTTFKFESSDDVSIDGLEGNLNIPSTGAVVSSVLGEKDFNTLDEPIKDTVIRDLKAIGLKFTHVLYPRQQKNLLAEWDLWGPLILCNAMALLLQEGSSVDSQHSGGPEFAQVFVIVWIGAMVATVNIKLLGGVISIFQSICVLGYCLLPLTIALVACRVILLAQQTTFLFILRFILTAVALGWAVWAAVKFLGSCCPVKRKLLAIYPVFLFYFVIAWTVVSRSNE